MLPPWQVMAELAPTVTSQVLADSQATAELLPAARVQLLPLHVKVAAFPSISGPPSTPQVAPLEQLKRQSSPQVPLQTLWLPQVPALPPAALISQALLCGQSSSVSVAAPPSASPRTQLCPEAQAQTETTEAGVVPPVPAEVGGSQLHAPLQTGGGGEDPPQAVARESQAATTAASLTTAGIGDISIG
jgi:hypothetical protein